MGKETYYFSHDSNALTDTKILNMRSDYGMEGYGLYWAIIEMMRNEETYKLELNKNTYRAIKTLTNTQIDIQKFIEDCIGDYQLFKEEEDKFYSESLLRRMLEYGRKKEINRENGRLGGRPKKTETKPNGLQSETEVKAKKTKGKESKGKKNKVKEIKEKENKIKEIYNSTCTNLPEIQKITEKREKAIDKFLQEFTEEQFQEICSIANNNPFLTGNNDRKWKADFDFLMRIDKATSILEGKYGSSTSSRNGTLKELKEEFKHEN